MAQPIIPVLPSITIIPIIAAKPDPQEETTGRSLEDHQYYPAPELPTLELSFPVMLLVFAILCLFIFAWRRP